jgi:hypothetical protein
MGDGLNYVCLFCIPCLFQLILDADNLKYCHEMVAHALHVDAALCRRYLNEKRAFQANTELFTESQCW